MGNQNTKPDVVDAIPITARSPQRNRNIKSPRNDLPRPIKDDPKKNAIQKSERISKGRDRESRGNKYEDTKCIWKSQELLPIEIYSSNRKYERNLEANKKLKRKKKSKQRMIKENFEIVTNSDYESGKKSEENSRARKREPIKDEKRHCQNMPTPSEVHLISDIINTVTELESTVIDEKRFEKSLRTAFSDQVENLQHLQVCLQVERERNKRLMELMNRYENEETCHFKENAIEGDPNINPKCALKLKAIEPNENMTHADRSTIRSYQHTFSNSLETPTSPVVLQQRYDEVCKSYNECQADLRRKDKLLTLAHCKQEALQAKCDRLTQQYLNAQQRIEDLQNIILKKNLGKSVKKKSDSIDSGESSTEWRSLCHGESEKTSKKFEVKPIFEHDSTEEVSSGDIEQRLIELEKYMSAVSEKAQLKSEKV